MIDKELMKKRICGIIDADTKLSEISEMVEAVDNINPWHPYPQEKPTDDRYVMVTFDSKGERFVTMAWYDHNVKCFHFVGEYMANKPVDIVAWSELPNPYEEANT